MCAVSLPLSTALIFNSNAKLASTCTGQSDIHSRLASNKVGMDGRKLEPWILLSVVFDLSLSVLIPR